MLIGYLGSSSGKVGGKVEIDSRLLADHRQVILTDIGYLHEKCPVDKGNEMRRE